MKFSLQIDRGVSGYPEALVTGSISSNGDDNALSLVPSKFKKWMDIMTTEATQHLPSHEPYNHWIDLQNSQHPPWGPVYLLSEADLQVLRNWLKEMIATKRFGHENTRQLHRSYSSPKLTAQALDYVWIIEVLTKSRLQIDTYFH
jgi:hypothetical protein